MKPKRSVKPTCPTPSDLSYNDDPDKGCVGYYDGSGFLGPTIPAARAQQLQQDLELAFRRRHFIHESGVGIIFGERYRQFSEEKFALAKDLEYKKSELLAGALCYLASSVVPLKMMGFIMKYWPWDMAWWKPVGDPIRNLARAGALLAAHLDALLVTRRTDAESFVPKSVLDAEEELKKRLGEQVKETLKLPVDRGVTHRDDILPAAVLSALDDSAPRMIDKAVTCHSALLAIERRAHLARVQADLAIKSANEFIDYLEAIGRASTYRERLAARLAHTNQEAKQEELDGPEELPL